MAVQESNEDAIALDRATSFCWLTLSAAMVGKIRPVGSEFLSQLHGRADSDSRLPACGVIVIGKKT
jgi:hypothetical protein